MSQVLSSNAIFASPPPLNLSTHRAEPIEVYFSLPNCLKLGVSEGRLDGLARHDLHGSAISFELSFSDLFDLFRFVSQIILQIYVGKIKRPGRAHFGFHTST